MIIITIIFIIITIITFCIHECLLQKFNYVYPTHPKVQRSHFAFSGDPGRRRLLCTTSLEPIDGISQNLYGYIIWASFRADLILMVLTLFSM